MELDQYYCGKIETDLQKYCRLISDASKLTTTDLHIIANMSRQDKLTILTVFNETISRLADYIITT